MITGEKTEEQLENEVVALRQRIAELERLKNNRKEAEALCAITQIVSQPLKLEGMLNSTLGKVVEVMSADMGLIYLA